MSGLRVNWKLKQFREATKDLPDDTEIFIEFGDCYEYRELQEHLQFFPASLDVAPALILDGGQEFDEDRYMGARLDAYLENGVGMTINSDGPKGVWER